uniref:reticulon-4-interacting protein 1 homolog, mitochondrial-like n=1 Tax=Ciona intestinalis TaxID=7719 RepID=UPI000180B216|nr:reticulon-4-interacting protein 1 homolog, mitochondrial-like [Ciona intestinalis]|eukprot:XP_002122943.1 reticulon-4-interacting protein 1 homolog, mitochondrial-like [Ciona intestinalis]
MLSSKNGLYLKQLTPITTLHKRCGFRKSFREKLDKEKEEHDKTFQEWAETENRGFRKQQYMRSWIIEKYGPPASVLKLDAVETPFARKMTSILDARRSYLYQAVRNTNDVMIKVHAASINPIDIRMCEGYGANLFNLKRSPIHYAASSVPGVSKMFDGYEFPIVLGRDFSGTVVDIGTGVFDIKLGDDVYGAPMLHTPGSFSDYVCVHLDCVVQKPATCSHIEAASIPYVGLTVLSAIKEIVVSQKHPKRALVLGGSGGIGTFAIQYLRAHGYTVITTCSTNAVPLCSNLGAECIDYKTKDVNEELQNVDKFSLVFDAVGVDASDWVSNVLVTNGSYVTLRSPVVENTDKLGAVVGLSTSVTDFTKKKAARPDVNIKWAYYKPDRHNLLEIARLVDSGMIKPVIDSIYSFDDVPKAFEVLSCGGARGKSVINVSGLTEASVKPDIEKIIHL